MEESEDYVFDHIGVITTVEQPNEDWIEVSKCWVTNPREHPEHIEFLRFREDTQRPRPIVEESHIAYQVKDLRPYLEQPGVEILIPPFIVAGFAEVVFVRKYGVNFEYMRYLNSTWFGR